MKYCSRLFSFKFILMALVVASLYGCGSSDIDPMSLRGGETRATLSPAYFSGRTAMAYRAARDTPEVLDSMYCYCECKKHFGHKSLLTCFVDRHGEHCGVCIEEAIMANEMYKNGKDIVSIRKAVDKRFSRN